MSPPSESQATIRALLGSLTRRERVLIVGRVALRLLAVAGGVAGVAMLAVWRAWPRETAALWIALIFGLGVWISVVVPWIQQWRAAGNAERQARLVEGLRPELRGRLITAVSAVAEGSAEAGNPLSGLMVARAARMLGDLRIDRVHPVRSVRRAAMVAFTLWLAAGVMSAIVPGGPGGVWRWWLDGFLARAEVESGDSKVAGPRARVGDLVLMYVYPEYTGLEPREIPNSTGDAHGPPGTLVQVKARSADPVEAAAVMAYGEPAVEAEVSEDGRLLAGSFTIAANPGQWQVVTYRKGKALPSRSFQIVPEPDLAPEVQIEAADGKLEVAVDERLVFPWRARDDYGLTRVMVEINGKERSVPLAAARERRAELDGRLMARPSDWGLGPGARAKLTIAAWDNDSVSGSKVGRSRTVELVVLGSAGVDQREDDRQRDLRAVFIDILGLSLEEAWPPGGGVPGAEVRGGGAPVGRPGGGGASRIGVPTAGALAAWGERVSARYEPVEAWREANVGDRPARGRREKLERDLVQRVARAGTELIRFTQVAFAPGSSATPRSDDFATLGTLRVAAIESLEDAILALDRMIQLRAMREVADTAKSLGKIAEEVRASLAEGMSAQEMLTRLERMERALSELMKNAAKMSESGLKEFVNQRGDEMGSLVEEIRKALAEGKLDEARELMERLARELEQFSQGVEDEMNRRSEQGNEQRQAAEDLRKELMELEKEQRSLQEQTRQLREKENGAQAKKDEAIWEKLRDRAEKHATAAESVAASREAPRSFHQKQRFANGSERSGHLRDAIVARDLNGARRASADARVAWMQGRDALRAGGGSPADEAALDSLERQLDEIDDLLDELERQSEQRPPQNSPQAQQLEQRQRSLQQRLEKAQQKAQEVAQGMQSRPRGLKEGLQDANESMKQASDNLGEGRPMPAEGSQGAAADRIREARESLEQSMRDQQSMQSSGQSGDGESGEEKREKGKEGGNDRGDGENESPSDDIEIPNPEQFRTPEEFRQELLEGMEGDVPEEYRELKRMYFEELVHQ